MVYTRKILAALAAIAVFTGFAHGATITSVGTTGTFDAAGSNDIDLDPTGQLTVFKADVATAFSNDQGGVIDWSTAVSPTPDNSGTSPNNFLGATDAWAISVPYGTSGAKTLTITFDRAVGLYTNNVANQVSGLSDTNAIIADGGNNPIGLAFNMAFSGADIAETGFGMLARSTFGTGVNSRATATFSDASTSVINYNVDDGSTDTFLHFKAPSGQTITSVFVTWVDDDGQSLANGQRRPVMDDFGFIVVPEPSSLALIALGVLGGLCALRRRRH
jgi:hypothetical protein